MRNAVTMCVFALGALGACTVSDGDDQTTVESDDADMKLGVDCRADFTLTGTFAPIAPLRPAEVPTGCWPVGNWTFTAALASNECPVAPTPLPSYAFRVDRTDRGLGWEESYTYMGDQASLFKLKVSEGGSGECEGGLELYSPDGTQYWNLRPSLDGTTLTGIAEYAVYFENQR
jgi:hypothetical protein